MLKTRIIFAAALVSVVFTVSLVAAVIIRPTEEEITAAIQKSKPREWTQAELEAIESRAIDISEIKPTDPKTSLYQYVFSSVKPSRPDPDLTVKLRPQTLQVRICNVESSEKYFRIWAGLVYINDHKPGAYGEFQNGWAYLFYFKDGKPVGYRPIAGWFDDHRIYLCPESFNL